MYPYLCMCLCYLSFHLFIIRNCLTQLWWLASSNLQCGPAGWRLKRAGGAGEIRRKSAREVPPAGETGLFFFFFFNILFIRFSREGKGGRKRRRETLMCERNINCLWHTPSQGPGPQPSHVPWLGIQPVTFWFAGQPTEPHQRLIFLFYSGFQLIR